MYWVGDARDRAAAAAPVMLTRLHLRYTRDSLPEDLVFQETQDRANFQARYVLRHPWTGPIDACEAAKPYFDSVRQRQEREAQTLASLTGWQSRSRFARAWRCRRTQPRALVGDACGSDPE